MLGIAYKATRSAIGAGTHGKIGEAVMSCGAKRQMTPAELKSARKSLGLSAERLAALVGVTRDAVCKWESGKRPIPRWIELVMYLLTRPVRD